MKLKFEKNNGDVLVSFVNNDDSNESFSYSNMVRKIYADKTIEDAEVIGDFTDIERDSIKVLIKELRNALDDATRSEER